MSSSPDAARSATFSGTLAALDCLDDETLVLLAEGALDDEGRALALQHVEDCEVCAALVGQAARVASAGNDRLGRYEVVERLGAGGMGEVFLALDPTLEREVAVKVVAVDPELDPKGATRVVEEAKTLARLNHPNIVKVFDVQQQQHAVCIAMEFIAGSTFAEWLDGTRDEREILRVFSLAGAGLAAAHAAGVVHRDFKPSNAMVAEDGRVVVLDFGLARQTDTHAPSEPGSPLAVSISAGEVTASAFAGTPVFMAPEQYRGIATPASDQYSFCLTLLEAIADHPAVPKLAGAGAVRHAKETRALADVALQRVNPRLRNVLLRGLDPDPARRWPGMTALLRALRPPGSSRAALGLGIGGLAVIGALAISAGAAPAVACDRADSRVTKVWDGARRDALRAAFAAADSPKIAADVEHEVESWTAAISGGYRDACEARHHRGNESDADFDTRIRCLDRRLRVLDATLAVLHDLDVGSAPGARRAVRALPAVAPCNDPATAITETPAPVDPVVAARVEGAQAELARAQTQMYLGRYRESLPRLDAIVEISAELGSDELEIGALLAFAENLRRLDDERATGVAERAVARARLSRDHRAAAAAAIELAHIARRRGELSVATQWADEARDAAEQANDRPIAARVLALQASIAIRRDEFERALALFREASRIHRSIDAAGTAYGFSLREIGMALRRLERFDEALQALAEAEAVLTAVYGADNPRLSAVVQETGVVHLVRGEPAKAVPLLRRNVELVSRKSGPTSKSTMMALVALGSALRDTDRPEDGLGPLRQAVEMLAEVPHGPREAGLTWGQYGKALAMAGQAEDALEALGRARALIETMEESGARTGMLAANLLSTADALERLGRSEEATAHRQRADALVPAR